LRVTKLIVVLHK